MDSAWFDSIVAWISAHPQAAGGVVFLIAFCDALVVLGILVPALPLLFAVGTLVGLGHLSGPYAISCAALGALLGDGLSFWVGHRWGPRLRGKWPFRRYPQLLERGETLFRRHGTKGIVIARYVGPVRPFVPVVAGMLRMPLKRYLPASLFAAITWGAAFIAPGWIFGASYDAVAAVADKLVLVLLGLFAALALAWAVVLYTWRWFAAHADNLLARALLWTRAHPRLGRYAAALIDPRRPESASLVILAACLFAVAWLWAGLTTSLLMQGGPLALDQTVHAAMFALRNPLADRLMASLAAIGSAPVLGTCSAFALAWLIWRKRWMAAAHWLTAIAIGLLLTEGLDAVIDMPRPPTAVAGFGFPSIAVTMTTVVFGFFAVLIARELPGRQRVWPYLLTGVATALVAFARLYLGAHWLSDVMAGVLLGVAWLLVLGIAYRRHSSRSFWMRPLAWAFYGSFALAAVWYAPRSADATLARFEPPPPRESLATADWWVHGLHDTRSFDIEIAGALQPLQERLVAQGWRVQPEAGWISVLGLLDETRPLPRQPVLPIALDAHPEEMLLRRKSGHADQIEVLRVWPAPARLEDGTPLWVGRFETMQARKRLRLLMLWKPLPSTAGMPADMRSAISTFPHQDADGRIRVRTDTAP
ncbi:bifunctional DedA family/phosphatase PAP2 family protein [Thermomonas sp.]|uniref:bifunctional DedA family/phosphatase PAP2 family protein n=1 Tax=Thermomonas sp. TaxID=1971895 RepID=UPI0024881C8A|nr:bifunctional DedA family/phosphatase PAP2 family protein [Thermomonas sp.]MDI1252540.1 bifunctional DedA family/phosphatase PAP2 family protein [Thermomonas sp.]